MGYTDLPQETEGIIVYSRQSTVLSQKTIDYKLSTINYSNVSEAYREGEEDFE